MTRPSVSARRVSEPTRPGHHHFATIWPSLTSISWTLPVSGRRNSDNRGLDKRVVDKHPTGVFEKKSVGNDDNYEKKNGPGGDEDVFFS